MSAVRYIGTDDPTDDRECVVFGLTFPLGEAVEVEDENLARRLATNPTFEACEAPKRRGRASAHDGDL